MEKEVYEFYFIVPNDDRRGYYYLALDKDGKNHYLQHKAKEVQGKSLSFNTIEKAREYINKYLDPALFDIEPFWTIDKYFCPNCGTGLNIKDIFITNNGIITNLATCRNNKCMLDWCIAETENRELIEIKRHYWG